MHSIRTAQEFFDEVVAHNFDYYENHPTSLPAAFNLAVSLFHMHDWVWHTFGRTALSQHLGVTVGDVGALKNHVLKQCEMFKYVQDVANASKHFALTKPATAATHAQNTTATGFGEGAYGVGRYGGHIVIDDGGTSVSFDEVVRAVRDYWEQLLNGLT